MVVEGANLFITEDARRLLESTGVHVFKDSTANKGGVTSSSMEVFASLAVPPEEFERLLTARADAPEPPLFYSRYVDCILERIEENCRGEFSVIWEANQQAPVGDRTNSKMMKIDASRRLSQEITSLQDHIAAADLDESFMRQVLSLAVPPPILEHCGLDGVLARVPRPYVKAIVAYWLASKYIYRHGIHGANAFAFHEFLQSFNAGAHHSRL
jgi:glutamate dehydrogenase